MFDVKTVLALIDANLLIYEPPISAIIKTFQIGVNLTEVADCPKEDEMCFIDRIRNDNVNRENAITAILHRESIDIEEIEDEKFIIVNINFQMVVEIAKKVNQSLHIYLYGGLSMQKLSEMEEVMVKNDQIDIALCEPCQNQDSSLHCTRQLYLVNHISIISTFDTKHDYNLSNLLNVYDRSSLVTMAVCVLVFILISSLKSTLWKSFWAYVDPIIGRRDNFTFKCFSYSIYLLALIPFLEIIRNELLASLIAVKEVKLDTVEDLLDPRVSVYMFNNPKQLKNESKMIDDVELSTKLNKLFTKVGNRTDTDKLLILLNDPNEFREKEMACINDDYKMNWVKASFEKIGQVHVASEKFFPSLVSDLCYKPNFKWKEMADKISLIYFESGLRYHMTDARVALASRIAYKVYKFMEEMMPVAYESLNLLLADHSNEDWKELNVEDLVSAFNLLAFQLCLCLIVFLLESLYSCIIFHL